MATFHFLFSSKTRKGNRKWDGILFFKNQNPKSYITQGLDFSLPQKLINKALTESNHLVVSQVILKV